MALKSTVSYTADKLFPAAVTDQHGNAVTYEYNKAKGLMTSASDNTGTVAYEYNSSNDLLTTVTKGSVSNSYDYTAGTSRNLTTIVRNNTYYNMTYDVFNNNIANKVGTQMLSQNTYGANNGLLQQLTYGTGQRVNYNYDAFGNISQISYNGTAAFKYFSDRSGAVNKQQDLVNNLETRFEYDTTGRLVRQYVTDTSKAVNTNRGLYSSEYGYDLNNNVTKFVNSTPGGTVVNSYTYGKDNFLEKHTLPSGKAVTYSYDNLGRTTKSALNTTTPLEHTYTYLLSDRNTEADNGKYRTTQIRWESIGDDWYRYTYDQQGNITVIEKRDADGNPVIQHEYTYDTMNQLIREWDHVSMQRKTYAYNAGGNLTTAGTYWYDNFNHGVTRQEITTYGYTDTNWNDKLTTYKGQEITYDAIGNPLNYRDGMVMTWKNGRQLATLQTGGNAISYSYDSGGTRVSKTVNGVKHTYQYVNGKLHFEQRGDATVKYSYNSGGSLVSAIYKPAGTTTETTYYYGYNWRGDVVALYNADGSKFCDYEYDAWGKVVSVKRASGADVTSATHFANFNPFRYRSYYYDTETGFYATGSRYYDPVVGRFLNADGVFADLNLYRYCLNNPVNYYDPSGCWAVKHEANGWSNYVSENGDTLYALSMEMYGAYHPLNYPAGHDPHRRLSAGEVRIGMPPPGGVGTQFDTIDDAAKSFVRRYNSASISERREYTSTIYTVGGKYTYGIPGIGPVRTGYSGEGVWGVGAWDHNVVAYVHTHGHYHGPLNNLFSQADLNIANNMSIYAYVGTPAGTVRKYDPWNPGKWDRANGFDRGYQIWP